MENENLRNLLTFNIKQEGSVHSILKRLETDQAEQQYKAEMQRRKLWENEVERIRVEIARQLETRYQERVQELEIFYENKDKKTQKSSVPQQNKSDLELSPNYSPEAFKPHRDLSRSYEG